jgi:hypothetical protein|tara:strand:- start:585 stop:725 length:141 start_codon:yes stop_codon:yes gene_type:complete
MSKESKQYSENQFWEDAHKYAFTTGEEQFVSEIAYIMTALHEEGTL